MMAKRGEHTTMVLTLDGELVLLRELAERRRVTRQTIYNGTVASPTEEFPSLRREIVVRPTGRPPDVFRLPDGTTGTAGEIACIYQVLVKTVRAWSAWNEQDRVMDVFPPDRRSVVDNNAKPC
jgi:hypothetical protein